ncbi:MAG TPA: SEC-C metal-binding domain-containing protein, partial [Candidatus Limnocylindrales bacterium]|nr:SEC-C metal-binding domain-containing protein [Candidatus Limnocylindrales bacterium]
QLNAALKAWHMFHKDQQYIVKDGEVVIVDEFTGRLMYGRRYSDGIHQAIEAKEGLSVRSEDQTLATITFQNYFRLYDKLAGMTGTAKTEEREFREIYGLSVVVMPTNRAVKRKHFQDIVYRTEEAKFNAVIDDIIAEHEKGRPVLVGTRSIEKSERLAGMLRRRGVECNVLNAKYHEQEAQIIKDAGQYGAVTIATNMAGRGVDIKLGEGVPELGGLHIIGTERHESRRIDNQLRGRSGRQGDPGTTRFYIALEDELMRLFGQERLQKMMDFVKFTDETPIEAGILSRSIENAQSKVENHNYEIRKSVLEYDDVMNKQREIIYGERRRVLSGEPMRDYFVNILRRKTSYAVDVGAPEEKHPSEWDLAAILDEIELIFPIKQDVSVEDLEKLDRDGMKELLFNHALAAYEEKEAEVTPEILQIVETQHILLPVIDRLWVDHLYIMDALKSGIGLRGYGQKDPRVEYEKEAFEIFEDLKNNIDDEAIKMVFSVQIQVAPPEMGEFTPPEQYANGAGNGAANGSGAVIPDASQLPPAPRMDPATAERLLGPAPKYEATQLHTNRDDQPAKPKQSAAGEKVGRNELCPCGSGKKYKRCHGAAA